MSVQSKTVALIKEAVNLALLCGASALVGLIIHSKW